MKRLIFIGCLLVALALPFGNGQVVSAHSIHKAPISASFNSRMIDDDIFTKSNTMNVSSIQSFLNSKVPVCQSGYTCLKDYAQNGQSAAQIIYNAAQDYNINPRVILVTLQKEQSLVTDDWPVSAQYRTAMGYGCPESQSVCDAEYYGFTNQVRLGTKLFRVGHDRFCGNNSSYPGWSLGAAWYTQDNNQQNPFTIDGKNTDVNTCATAALYNYTPHRPDSAWLNAGDGSHYYGNYNFVTTFQSWFGSTTANISVVKKPSSATLFLRYENTKYPIPSLEMRTAWGLDTIGYQTLSEGTVNSLTTKAALTRAVKTINGGSTVYFVDDAKHYSVGSYSMLEAWQLDSQVINVPLEALALTTGSGGLSYSIKSPSDSTVYLRDSGNARPFPSVTLWKAWEGESPKVIALSQPYFDGLTVGSNLTGAKLSHGGLTYFVNNRQRFSLSTNSAPLYPGTALTVTDATFNRLANAGSATHLLKADDSSTIYLVDNAQKLPIPSMGLVKAWGGTTAYTVLNPSGASLFTTGSTLASYLGNSVASELYLVNNGQKRLVPNAGLETAYAGTGSVYDATANLLNRLADGSNASGFIKGATSSSIYVLDNGSKRPIQSFNDYKLWNGTRDETLTVVNNPVLDQFSTGSPVTAYVASGPTNYVFDNGSYHSASGAVATQWSLSSPAAINAATLSRFTNGGALTVNIQTSSTKYKVVNGISYSTTNANLANLWDIDSPLNVSSTLINRFTSVKPLALFVKSPDSSTVYVRDNGTLYPVPSMPILRNLGYSGKLVTMTQSDVDALTTGSDIGYLVGNSGTNYIVDNGSKRAPEQAGDIAEWGSVLGVSADLISYLSSASSVRPTVKGSSATIYAIEGGQKRPISSYALYLAQHAPYSSVSNKLLDAIPTGSAL